MSDSNRSQAESSDTPDVESEPNEDVVSPTEAAPPREMILRHRHVGWTWAWQILAILGWVSLLVVYGLLEYHWYVAADFYDDSQGITEIHHSGEKSATDRIAIIKISGVIYDGAGYVKSQIDRVTEDERVKAVVLRVNSPGGTVSGSDYIYHQLNRMLDKREIPIVVSMGSVAASGGYYVSMVVGDQKDSIFAEPTCTTGSIGVIIPHWNYAELMETYGVIDDSIMSHPRKRMLSPSRKMPEDHRELLQQYVDESFRRFKKVVLNGRPALRAEGVSTFKLNEPDESSQEIVVASEGRDVATGEIFHAPTALRYGLVDRLGFVEDAVERAAELAELDSEQVKVVEYSRPAPWIELPYLSQANSANALMDVLMEINSPRAYYLSNNLPPLFSSWEDPYQIQAERAKD